VVGKDELLSRIWPGRIVEENRLQSEISALRKALGADRDLIQMVSGEGTNSPARSGQASARDRFLRPWPFRSLPLQPTSARVYPN
jgi:DNA-binding winged helix-turn-helix (wHTH) protein